MDWKQELKKVGFFRAGGGGQAGQLSHPSEHHCYPLSPPGNGLSDVPDDKGVRESGSGQVCSNPDSASNPSRHSGKS